MRHETERKKPTVIQQFNAGMDDTHIKSIISVVGHV